MTCHGAQQEPCDEMLLDGALKQMLINTVEIVRDKEGRHHKDVM